MQTDLHPGPGTGRKSVAPRSYKSIRKKRFLAELARTSHVSRSAARAGVSLSTIYLWRTNDAGFRRRWLRALAAGYELLEGQNIAVIGSEVIQFASAVSLGENRYRLSGFFRGLGGTEAAMSGHGPQEDIVMLDGDVLARIDPASVPAGSATTIFALGRDDAEPVPASLSMVGRSTRPWSPVHPAWSWQANGDLQIGWTRRSRGGLVWADHVDVPLAENFERYHVLVAPEGVPGEPQLFEAPGSQLLLSAELLGQFRLAGASRISVRLHQLGQGGLSDSLACSIPI